MASQTTNYMTGDAAFAVNRNGIIVSWNPAAEKMFKFPASTVLGRRCWKLLCGQDIYGNRYCCERCPVREMAVQNELVHSFEASLKTYSDGMKKVTINCLLVYGGPGEELLLHICSAAEEEPKYAEKTHHSPRHSANLQRGALTNRELEVLSFLAEGKTTKEIASLMCIGYATVRNHIQHTLYKLHVHNRLEAVIMGKRLDIV